MTIEPAGRALMLRRPLESADHDVADVLDWAVRNNVVDSKQRRLAISIPFRTFT